MSTRVIISLVIKRIQDIYSNNHFSELYKMAAKTS